MTPKRIFALILVVTCGAVMASCASTRFEHTPAPAARSSSSASSPAETVRTAQPAAIAVSSEPWSFRGYEGEVIRTPHYRIFTTSTNPVMTQRLTHLVEESMDRYRGAITDLPAPPLRLDTYLMENRPQWEQVTRLLTAHHADTLVRIERGGYATRGVAVYFDIGLADTMSIAAHEGWHQYTQRTFRDRLPIWLEEGMAVYHEGHRWDGTRPVFQPWANPERYDRLREAVSEERFIPFSVLVTMTPNDHLSGNSPSILDFYAHVWAAAHFLAESPNLRPALASILSDAASGRLRAGGAGNGRDTGRAAPRNRPNWGVDPIILYTGLDSAALDERYEAFVREIVRPGGRDRVISGRSPVRAIGE